MSFADIAQKYGFERKHDRSVGPGAASCVVVTPADRPSMKLIIERSPGGGWWELHAGEYGLIKQRFASLIETDEDALISVTSEPQYKRALSGTHVSGSLVLCTSYANRMSDSEQNNVGAAALEIQGVLERYGLKPTTKWSIKKA